MIERFLGILSAIIVIFGLSLLIIPGFGIILGVLFG